ncbi:DUF317 domain-containing protein [Streptomyces sp. NPDC004682]
MSHPNQFPVWLAMFVDRQAAKWLDTSPRHLAGPGDAAYVTHGLAAAGWNLTSDPLGAEITLRSPDRRYILKFDPTDTSTWWRLRGLSTCNERFWYAEFDEFVPAEILGCVTDALVSPPPAEAISPLRVLMGTEWRIDSRGLAVSDRSGCRVERYLELGGDRTLPWHEPGPVAWVVKARGRRDATDTGRHLWQARFSRDTPERLVAAFVAGLSDPAPLRRGRTDRTAHGVVKRVTPLTEKQITNAHIARIKSLRPPARPARWPWRKPATTPGTGGPTPPAARR